MTIIRLGISSAAAATGLPDYNDVQIVSGVTAADLNDTSGASTGISLSSDVTLADSATDNNVTGDVSPFVKAALDFYQFINSNVTLTFSGFTPNETVIFSFIGHSSTQGTRDTDVTINSTTQTYDVSGTTTPNPPVVITEAADGNGDLAVTFVSTVANNQYFSAIQLEYGSLNTLTITEDSVQPGGQLTLNTSITDATSASGSDGTTILSLTDFAGSDGSFTANAPAIPVGSAGWAPGATITITITNGVDTAADTVTLAAPDGFLTLTATTQASGLIPGNLGYVGDPGLDAALTPGDIVWTDFAGDNPDGTTDKPESLPLTVNRYTFDLETSVYSYVQYTYPSDVLTRVSNRTQAMAFKFSIGI